jgi:hypothetical protein
MKSHLDPNEGLVPARVPSDWYEAALDCWREEQEKSEAAADEHRKAMNEAGHLLADALEWLESEACGLDCPRNRDDYDCTCGLEDLKGRLRDWLELPRVCPTCHGKGGTLPNGVQYCNCD